MIANAASRLDNNVDGRDRGLRTTLAETKVTAPKACLEAIDFSMQVHGGAGLSSRTTILPFLWTTARALRIADGPDDVHIQTIYKLELKSKL